MKLFHFFLSIWQQKRTLKLLYFIIFFLLLCSIRFTIIAEYFTFASIINHKVVLLATIKKHYWWSVLCYILCYMSSIILLLPAATLFAFVGGFLFGSTQGAIYATGAITIGSTVSFLIMRFFCADYAKKKLEKTMKHATDFFEKKGGIIYLILLRFMVFIPIALVNSSLAISNITVISFFISTLIGVFPAIMVYAYFGRHLATVHSFTDLFSGTLLSILGFFIGGSMLIGYLYYRVTNQGRSVLSQ